MGMMPNEPHGFTRQPDRRLVVRHEMYVVTPAMLADPVLVGLVTRPVP